MDNQELIKEILERIKQNRKYRTISDEIVRKEIENYLKSHPEIEQKSKEELKIKKSFIKKIVKEIRAKLHRLYSSYQTKGKNKSNFYLEELKNIVNNKLINNHQLKQLTDKLLSLTVSTKERLNDYKFIYQEIFKITGKPETIIDLGCGLNPISFPYMELKKLVYYAYDIDKEDIIFLNNYFKIMEAQGLNGKANILDITKINKLGQLPNSDIIFMFKLIDLIDSKSKKKKKISEPLIKYLLKNKTKFIVASFSTKTLSRKPMKLPRRRGFELMLERNDLKFKSFSTHNEVFYVVYD